MKDRRIIGAVIVGVIALLVVVAVVASGGDGRGERPDRGVAVARPPAGMSSVRTAPISELPPATLTRSTTSTTSATSTTAKPVAVAPAPCAAYQGSDPYFVVCGPTSAKTGERAVFDLVARGRVRDDCGSPTVDWGDGTGNVVCMIACKSYPTSEQSIERKFAHTYTEPGAYTLRFVLQGCGPDPRPQAEIAMELQVK